MLAQYDGSVLGRPVYLAVRTKRDFGVVAPMLTLHSQIDGEVYDVSKGSAYRPGGSYSFL